MDTNVLQQTQQQEIADHLLIEQASAGDQEAFEILVQRYQQTLYRFVRAHMGNEQAHDVIQFVLLQLYLSLPKLKQQLSEGWRDMSLKPWLFRVARNRCIDETRKHKRDVLFFSELEQFNGEEDISLLATLQDPAPNPEELAEQQCEQEFLCEVIQMLPERFRDVVWLRYKEDLSFINIGQRLNIPPTTAKTYFYRARSKMRVFLSNDCLTMPISV